MTSSRTMFVDKLIQRARVLEDSAIETAETLSVDPDWPKTSHARVELARLRLECAAVLKARANEAAG